MHNLMPGAGPMLSRQYGYSDEQFRAMIAKHEAEVAAAKEAQETQDEDEPNKKKPHPAKRSKKR